MEISPVERLRRCVLMKLLLLLLTFSCLAVYGNAVQLTKELCQIEETQNYSDKNLRKAAAALTHRNYRVRFSAMRILIQAGKKYPQATPALLDTIKNPPQKHLPGFAVTTLLVTEPDAFAILEKFYDSATSDWKQTLANALWNLPGVPEKFRKKLSWAESGYKNNVPSQLANGGFENGLDNWELICRDGASGKISLQNKIVRSGSKALQIEKSNGLGFLELRSKKLVEIPANETWFFRGYYHTGNAPAESLILFRLLDEHGADIPDSQWNTIRGNYIRRTFSYTRTSPPGVWQKNLMTLKSTPRPRLCRPVIRIYGNPVTLYLDDLTLPSPLWTLPSSTQYPALPSGTLESAQKILDARPQAFVKTASYPSGAVGIKINDKIYPPVLYYPLLPDFGDYKSFNAAGIKISNVVLNLSTGPEQSHFANLASVPVWPDAGTKKYNFTPLLSSLRRTLRLIPENHIILGFNVSWPENYLDKNPETLWLNSKGHCAWGNTLHLRGFFPEKPGRNMFRWPSPYADKPFSDIADMLKAFIAELKKTGMDKMVIGAFVVGGHDGQFEIRDPDFSPAGKKSWRAWLKKKYRTDKALQKAWGNPEVTLANAQVVEKSYRGTQFLSFPRDRHRFDYEIFREERIWKIKEIMLKGIREALGKPVLGTAWQMDRFNVKNPSRFFEADVLDILVTQPNYQHRNPGLISGELVPFNSFRKHNKLWLSEFDFRSFVRENYRNEVTTEKIGIPQNIAAFQSTFRKQAAQQIATGNGGWWMFDIDNNSFGHPALMREIKTGYDIYDRIHRKKDTLLKMQCAVIMKRDSINGERNWLAASLCENQGWLFASSGVPFDTWYLDDFLSSGKTKQYKMICFLNTYQLSAKEREQIDKMLKKDNRTLIFCYGSGYVTQRNNSVEAMKKLTGFDIKTDFRRRRPLVLSCVQNLNPIQGMQDVNRSLYSDFPAPGRAPWDIQRFRVLPGPADKVYARYADDKTAAIVSRKFPSWRSVYVASPGGISAELFHLLAEQSGIYRISAPGKAWSCVNNRFLSIYALHNGKTVFTLPCDADFVQDVFSGSRLPVRKRTLRLNLKAGETHWFIIHKK